MRAVAGWAVVCVVVAACAGPPSAASATAATATAPTPTLAPTAEPTAPPSPSPSAPVEPASLEDLIDPAEMRMHLEALQRIADERDGNRATGTAAFDESVRYLSGHLIDAGYRVQHEVFEVEGVSTTNVIVEQPGAGEGVLMLGAHLDSVADGPGINDNGSGVTALLAIAEAVRRLPAPKLTVRFAFWAAEEDGPFGSRSYVDDRTPEELSEIRAYLNFDMLASPNAVRFVYDEADASPGSDAITDLFADYFENAGLAWEPVDLEGDSDHGPFIDAGIPTGGLFSGGIEPVTDGQAERFGAVAGQPADPCSHRTCDTIDNVDLATLDEMTSAIAHAVVTIAYEGG